MIPMMRDAFERRWLIAGVELVPLVGAIAASPDRFVLFIPAAAALVLAWRMERAATWLLLALPWLPLANLEPLGVFAGGAGALYPSEAILLGAISGLALAGRRPVASSGGMRAAAVALTLWMVVSALAGPSAGAVLVWRAVRIAFLAWAAFELGHASRPAQAWGLIASAGVWLTAMGVIAVVEGAGSPGSIGRAVGGSELLVVHLTLWLPLMLAGWLDRGSWLGLVALVAGAVTLVLSFSRSGWVGGFVGCLVAAALVGVQSGRRVAWIVAGSGLILGVLGAAVLGGVVEVGLPAPYAERFGSLGSVGVLSDRSEEWGRAAEVLARSPLFGELDAPNAYNLVLGLASRSGWPILLPFVWLVAAALLACVRARRGWAGGIAPGVAGAVVALLVTGVGEASLGARVMPEAMAIFGIAAATHHAAAGAEVRATRAIDP